MGAFSSGNQPAKKKKSAKEGKLIAQGRRTSKNERRSSKIVRLAVLHGKAIHHDGIKECDTEKYELACEEMQVSVNEEEVEVEQKLTMEEKETMGFLVVTQEELRIAVKVCYVIEFNEPDESDWPKLISQLSTRFGMHYNTVKQLFTSCHDGQTSPEKQMKGAGRKHKLDRNNAGLIAGAAALNGSTSPNMATEICNAVNELNFPDKLKTDYSVCRNTFMATLKAYTDFECRAVLRRKTGKKDPGCDWAVARKTIAQQMLEQKKMGEQLDSNAISYVQAFRSNAPPPIFPNAILFLDENHSVASLGGVGHEGSFASRQYFVSVDRMTGALKKRIPFSVPSVQVALRPIAFNKMSSASLKRLLGALY